MKKVLSIVLGILLSFTIANAMEEFDRYLYAYKTGDSISVGWDLTENAVYYEVRLFHFEWDQEVLLPVALGRTEALMITFATPKSGHYEFWVRGCNDSPESPCGEWAKNINVEHASVNGQPRAWWIYSFTGPPTGGGIQ